MLEFFGHPDTGGVYCTSFSLFFDSVRRGYKIDLPEYGEVLVEKVTYHASYANVLTIGFEYKDNLTQLDIQFSKVGYHPVT